MKIAKILILLLLVAFVGIQFVPTYRNLTSVTPKTDFALVNKVPKTIQEKIQTSCYDCHSNNTDYPWYSKIQPVAWYLENHIIDGKKQLNFNDWGKYSDRKKQNKLEFIINQINDGEMPLPSYTLIHRDAILSKSDKKLVIDYLRQLNNSLN